MPRAFSETEEASIRDILRKNGRELFERHGVAKTSIDEIVRPAGIAKGSFYKFYPSKEVLFFELLDETQNSIREPMTRPGHEKRTRAVFENMLRLMVKRIGSEPLLRFLGNKSEILAIARKVPVEIMAEHQARDAEFVRTAIKLWNHRPKAPKNDQVAAHMSLLLMIQHNETMLGERLYPHAEAALVTSFANLFFD